ncbi:MAG: trifunctional transcriptional regulator/proline dehydrogenase/L-glutamate gamma-semialdehyde, partial [Pseudomonadota bacterium]|jgi:RHH-type proline utilization regulon transcriptional repressor/proline dehydrogenase/delta 1-pyrroline-5-carboxylate dehydrogenase
MCLAESLLRIPDIKTQNELIRDKINQGDWLKYIKSQNLFVTSASWGLVISGKIVKLSTSNDLTNSLLNVLKKFGEPVIRKAIQTVVKAFGTQFVMAETIDGAIQAAATKEKLGYLFSYDMLGESAVNENDALAYFKSYSEAIIAVGKAANNKGVIDGSGISVKLTAIHSRYQREQYPLVINELYVRLKELFLLAKQYNIAIFIDAEECRHLDLSLDLLEMLLSDSDLAGFKGFGFVVQSYQKRATSVINYLIKLAQSNQNRILVRLVKGSYWDSEIKRAQLNGDADYPVFTRKFYTDLSYLVCAQELFKANDIIYPLFATHNALTLATIYYLGQDKKFEFQCLYGMGERLYNNIVGKDNLDVKCRIYAPVGSYNTLLAYLVRRMLENGANTSFVNQIVDKNITINDLLLNPITLAKNTLGLSNPSICKPGELYLPQRLNSQGLDLSDEALLIKLQTELSILDKKFYIAYPLINNDSAYNDKEVLSIYEPGDNSVKVGQLYMATATDAENAIAIAKDAFAKWSNTDVTIRSKCLNIVADKFEENYIQLLSLLVREAGKTLANAINEVREAVDFCRYYASRAVNDLQPGNYKALGPFVCISPWNFPLAIFVGEISSCLVAGNTVIAKPALNTSLIAHFVINLFYEAGCPRDVLLFIPGSGSSIGDCLTKSNSISGVIFTGSNEVAQSINKNLASKEFNSVLIAETGGQNTMIVDSSALPEQVVVDVIASSFDSAGQRCSALRVLYLQADIADKIIRMLSYAMKELRVGNPKNLATDVGPVIDLKAKKAIEEHIKKMKNNARLFFQSSLTIDCDNGYFVAPTLIEIGHISEIKKEIFGPVLHIIRYEANRIKELIKEINSTGYGLTQGLHSRIEDRIEYLSQKINAGNFYINRNIIGATVGVQPFGGEGLSGTGPKAGGPLYLYRLVTAKYDPYGKYRLREYNFEKLTKFMSKIDAVIEDVEQREFLLNYADYIREHSPLLRQIDLSGPTGEKNYMFFAKRGIVGCLATTVKEYIMQIICAIACGNEVALIKDETTELLESILAQKSLISYNEFMQQPLNVVTVSNNYKLTKKFNMELSCRNGPIVTKVYEDDDGYYNLYLLVNERCVCINTTSSGGNIHLMTIKDIV